LEKKPMVFSPMQKTFWEFFRKEKLLSENVRFFKNTHFPTGRRRSGLGRNGFFFVQ
jgi:hypothetical protein